MSAADLDIAVRPTPFHHRMAELSRTNEWTRQLGWTLAAGFDTPETEHAALRNRCTFADRTALATYEVSGPEARAYLDRLAGGIGGHMKVGSSNRVVLCDDDGHLIADGTVMQVDDHRSWLVLPVRVSDWLEISRHGFDCTIEDISDHITTLAVEGPSACAALLSAGFGGLEALRPGGVRDMKLGRTHCVVTRRSPLGGLGYELRLSVEGALPVLDRFRREAAYFAPVPIGTNVQSLAQLEAGFPRAGIDYAPALTADLANRRTPLELGLGRFLRLDADAFTGRKALERQRLRGAGHALVGLEVEGTDLPDGTTVFDGDAPAGRVTSIAWSPSCKRVIALADVSSDVLGSARALNMRGADGRRIAATIVPRPFYICANARRTPPEAQ